jgi:membrane associated rhomboid family serine protease
VIPIADSPVARSFPYVNVMLIVVNLLVFIYEVVLSGQTIRGNVTELDRFILDWGNVPACTFDALGRDVTSPVGVARCDDQPAPLLTAFSAMFMHGSWLHVLGNMLFLWIFGDNVEDAMGHLRYALFYVLGGLLAAAAHGLVNPNDLTPAIGASGAIAGVMGAYILLFPRSIVTAVIFVVIPIPVPAWLMIGFWFVSQLFYGFGSLGPDTAAGGVAYFAHIGGFVAGLVLVNLFVIGRRDRVRRERRYETW